MKTYRITALRTTGLGDGSIQVFCKAYLGATEFDYSVSMNALSKTKVQMKSELDAFVLSFLNNEQQKAALIAELSPYVGQTFTI